METDKIYTQPNTIKNVAVLVIPSIIALVIIALYQTVDGIFIGMFSGELAIGVVNLYLPVLYVISSIGLLLASGCNAYLPKLVGEGKKDEADKAFSSTVILLVILCAVLSAALLIFREPIIYALGADEANAGYLRLYYSIISTGALAVATQVLVDTLLVADGKAAMTVVLSVIGGVINCGLDYLFMKSFHWGVTGAAIATLLGYSVTLIYGIYYFVFSGKSQYRIRLTVPNFKAFFRVCIAGAFGFIANIASAVSALVLNNIMNNIGGAAGISALTATSFVQYILTSIGLGIGYGAEPVMSYHFGAKNTKEQHRLCKNSLLLTSALSAACTVLVFILARPVVSLFFDAESEIGNVACSGLRLMIIGGLFCELNCLLTVFFAAWGKNKVSGGFSLVRTLIIPVILYIVMSKLFGITGLWLSWPIAEFICLAAGFVFYAKAQKEIGI